jgi:hypothetical protein
MQYNSKIDVLRLIPTSDGMGGSNDIEATIFRNLPCRINWISGQRRIFFDKQSYFRDGKIFCKVVDILQTDIIRYNGIKYTIVSLQRPDNSANHILLEIKIIE